jgi:anti-sigma factor RsiW
MTGPACRDIRQALGIYVVGAIDPAERSVVDIHLSTCPDCREELAGLAGLPALLGRVPASEAERLILHSDDLHDPQPPAELLNSLLRRVAERRASRRWRGILAAAAAIVIAVAGGAVGARLVAPGGQATPAAAVQTPVTDTASHFNPRTGVTAIVRYSRRSWGTQMDVWVSGIPGGTACQLVVVDSSGMKSTAGSWTVPGGGRDSNYPASSELPASRLSSFEVISGGRVLVTVPVS